MTAKLCASEPVPAVVGTATIGQAGRQVRAVVLELPDRAVVDGSEVDRLGRVHRGTAADRDDDRARQAEVPQVARAALDGRRGRVRLDLVEHGRSRGRPRRGRRRSGRRSRRGGRPDRSRRTRASRRPRRPARGAARSPRPRTGPGCAGSSRTTRSASAVTARPRATVSVEVSRRTVSQRRQPAEWNQRSVVAPSGFSKTQTSSKSRSSGSVIQSGTARRSPPNVNSSIGRRPQRGQSSQSISASPPSPGRPGRGRAGSGRARTARSARAAGPWRSARPSPRRRPGWP